VDDELPNIAHSFLTCLKKLDERVRQTVMQNTVLSGGIFSVKNFALRFRDELMRYVNKGN
jgi:actin-related protein